MESNQPRRAWRAKSREGRRGRAQGPGRLGFLAWFPQTLQGKGEGVSPRSESPPT